MNGFAGWLSQLNFDKFAELLIVVAASLLCLTVHEVSHGYAAYRLGDPTAKLAGRLSLNPLRHIDPVGLLCMAVAHFGWAKAVPIDPACFKHFRRDTAITALAGPVSNVLLAFVLMPIYAALHWLWFYVGRPEWLLYFAEFFWYGAVLSASLAVFNILPLPPLDGSKVLFSLLPERRYQTLLRYERYGMIVLAVLLVTGLLDKPLGVMQQGAVNILYKLCLWPIDLLNSLVF